MTFYPFTITYFCKATAFCCCLLLQHLSSVQTDSTDVRHLNTPLFKPQDFGSQLVDIICAIYQSGDFPER